MERYIAALKQGFVPTASQTSSINDKYFTIAGSLNTQGKSLFYFGFFRRFAAGLHKITLEQLEERVIGAED